MKQEYTDKMKAYQQPEYEAFLKEKCVLNAKQFLQASMIYLNYALMTAKLYDNIGKKNIWMVLTLKPCKYQYSIIKKR